MNVSSMDESARQKDEETEKQSQDMLSEGGARQPEKVCLSREEYEALVKKSKEFESLQDRLLRSAADFDNAKKRLVKEREDFLKFALEDVLRELIPILDNLERALAHAAGEDEKAKSIRDGFSLIHKQLSDMLCERGLKRLASVGKLFDPHREEAVGHIVSEHKPEGTILEEMVPGYELNGKLIRPAQVKISTKKKTNLGEKEEEIT